MSDHTTPPRNGFDQFGPDDDGWNLDGDGAIGIGLFARALQVWSIFREQQPVTVEQAADTFGVWPRHIVEAVEWHPFMYLEGPRDDFYKLTIEHDGE